MARQLGASQVRCSYHSSDGRPGLLIDVAGEKGLDALPAHYPIGVDDLQRALSTHAASAR